MSKRALRDTEDGTQDSEAFSARALEEAFERRRKKSDEIRTLVTDGLLRSDPIDLLDQLCARWELDAKAAPVDAFTQLALSNFGLVYNEDINLDAPQEYGLRKLDETIERHEQEAIAVFNAIKQLDPEGTQPDLQHRATKVIEMVYYAKRVVLSAFQARLAVHQLHCSDNTLAQDLDLLLGSWTLRFRWIDQTKSTPLQKLLLHLLDTAMEKRYRKHNGWVFEPIVVDGHETHAWRQVCEIKDFVYESAKKEVHWEQWCNLTASGNNGRMAVEHLSSSNDYQFRFLEKNRSVFSFRNGVYLAREDRFYRFGSNDEPLSDSVVSAKFFDAELDTFEGTHWRDIPTPSMHCIMAYQEWPAAVCDWMYIALGRLLYNVGVLDGWQVIPFLHGTAACGKCFLTDTGIMLHDGTSRAVQDINVGDLLMGDDGTPRTVLTLARGVDDMFSLVPRRKGFPTVTVTREHVLCLKYTNQGCISDWKPYGKRIHYFNSASHRGLQKKFTKMDAMAEFVDGLDRDETFEMTVAEYMELPPYLHNYLVAYRVAVEFGPAEEPLFDPWALGAWLGDGHSAGARITMADEEIVSAFRQAAAASGLAVTEGAGLYLYGISQPKGQQSTGGNAFLQALKGYGLVNNKHIPHALKTGSRATRMEVLAGLLDTDGWYNPGGHYEITQKNERLADDIMFVARSLGFGVTKTPTVKSCMWKGERREGVYFRLNIFGAGIDDIPVRVERKKASAELKHTKNCLRYGFDIVPAGRAEYFGFETDGNHRFLLEDFTVTHNSTISLKVAKLFYEHCDVGVMSNNIERQFGISAFWDKLLFVAPEIKGDLKVEQAEFQSIVSGETVQISAKHKKAFTVEWTTPGIMAGNEVPQFTDNAGSVQRRFLVFSFDKAVVNGDMRLADKLATELPALLVKCNRAYLEAAARWGGKNIWTVLPIYFHNTRDELAQAVNSIEAFLVSTDVVLDPDKHCPYKEFRDAWKSFSINNGYNQHNKPVTLNIFRTPFDKFGLRMVTETREYRGTVKNNVQWVVGMDVSEGDECGDGGYALG